MDNSEPKSDVAIFGGGCFWCTEAVFKMLKGVNSVLPGYTGGTVLNPTYEQVCGGKTDHVEAVKVTYDPKLTTYNNLLTVFFGSHDSTTRNRQGNDVGTEYRSAIFYTTPEQKKAAEDFISDINTSNTHGTPVVTELEPLDVFYEAENYHKDYFDNNKGNSYCEVVINPKLEKVQKEFASLLSSSEKH